LLDPASASVPASFVAQGQPSPLAVSVARAEVSARATGTGAPKTRKFCGWDRQWRQLIQTLGSRTQAGWKARKGNDLIRLVRTSDRPCGQTRRSASWPPAGASPFTSLPWGESACCFRPKIVAAVLSTGSDPSARANAKSGKLEKELVHRDTTVGHSAKSYHC